LPDEPPVNYLFHHQLEINLLTQSIQFQEAGEKSMASPCQPRSSCFDKCLEVAVPWADLQIRLIIRCG